jgi:hypothetical protein
MTSVISLFSTVAVYFSREQTEHTVILLFQTYDVRFNLMLLRLMHKRDEILTYGNIYLDTEECISKYPSTRGTKTCC